MSGLRSPDGLLHVVSDGPSPSRQYALCDIIEFDESKKYSMGARVIALPSRTWSWDDIEDVAPTCLTCIGIVREAIRD